MALVPLITLKGLRGSKRLESEILARADKLAHYYPSIVKCRVLVELAERRHESGNRVHVRLELSIPGQDIIVSHTANSRDSVRAKETAEPSKSLERSPEYKHALLAVHDAFMAARRQLQDRARRQRGGIKAHTIRKQAQARVPKRKAAMR